VRLYVYCLLLALLAALLVPISASAQTDTFCTAVHDANGDRVGQAAQSGGVTTLLLNQNDVVVRLRAQTGRIEGNATIFYTEASCNGDAYMLANFVQPEAGKDYLSNEVWYQDTTVLPTYINAASQRHISGACEPTPQGGEMVPALNFTLPAYTPPFHLEPEACFTPDPTVAALTPYGLGAMAFVLVFGAYLMMQRRYA
jgi:hypothetical protein